MQNPQPNPEQSKKDAAEKLAQFLLARKKLESSLIDIVKEHREYNTYIGDFISFMEIPSFLAVTFNSLSIGLSIVTFFKISRTSSLAAGE